MNKCNCNGAGEMPGHEGEQPGLEEFNSFVESREEDIIDAYLDSLNNTISIEDIPESFIQSYYEGACQNEGN